MELITIIRQAIGWLSFALLLFAILVLLFSSAAAQNVRRAAFSEGKERAFFFDSAKIGEQDTYIIKLKKGQSCRVEVEWKGRDIADEGQGLSGFTIVYPNGRKLVDTQDDYIQAKIDGDFKVIVSPKTRKTNYRYRIVFIRT